MTRARLDLDGRRCNGCKIYKTGDFFTTHKDVKGSPRLNTECKKCMGMRGKRYRANNPLKVAQSQLRYWRGEVERLRVSKKLEMSK